MPLFEPAATGSTTVTQVEIDFGATPTNTKTFTITDSSVSVTSKIVCVQEGGAATGRQADETEMDTLSFKPQPGTGQFDVLVNSEDGPVAGKYKFNYVVG